MPESDEDELHRLRRSLYRRDAPPGALERVQALLAAAPAAPAGPGLPAPEVAPPAGSGPLASPEAPPGAPRTGRRRIRIVAGATAAAVVAIGVVLVALQPPAPPKGVASALAPALSRSDAARLDRALDAETAPWGPTSAGALVVGVVQAADLPQLQVWHDRDAFSWVQRGTGPLHRDLAAGQRARPAAQPLSIIVRCDGDDAYRWTVRGTTPGSGVVHLLASGRADHCDRATVTTAVLPSGTRITAFDLRLDRDTAWTMAVVTPAA